MGRDKKKGGGLSKILFDALGEAVHVFEDGTAIKKLHAADFLQTGKQFCKECHCEMDKSSNYWDCPVCGYTIFKEEVEETGGYPTLESTYEDDFGYFGEDEDDDD